MNPTVQAKMERWRVEADALPVPQIIGDRCISPGNVFFQVEGGRDEAGRYAVAWEVCTATWIGLGVYFRVVLV